MIVAARNLGVKALRRLGGMHKPVVRLMRRSGRARELAAHAADARGVEREIAAVAAAGTHIVAGPWLAEVGYEALYWLPFLRWFRNAYRISADRITVVSRGGVEAWYSGLADGYLDIFDVLGPAEFVELNDRRQRLDEGGGRKQSTAGSLDDRILQSVSKRGHGAVTVLHPSLMFRLFRHVWHDTLPFDFFWSRTEYAAVARPPRPDLKGLPPAYVALKLYAGTALPDSPGHRQALRTLVTQVAATSPVVCLDTGTAFDEHHEFVFDGIPNVTSARQWMTPRDNLGLQTALAAHARFFLGTCGGLAWLMPFMGVPTVGVYADDRQLTTHLLTARQAGRRAGAAEFSLLDLRALARLDPVNWPSADSERRS